MTGLGWVRFAATITLVAIVGLVAAGYVLVKQRFPVPFRDTYEIEAVLPAVDGVAPGLGQGVNVAGVRVGSIDGARIERGKAVLTLRIDRKDLPSVHADARATLRPITPLKDMELDLVPGSAPAPELGGDRRIEITSTSSPVPLADLLSTLDADTRTYLSGLVGGLDGGTRGRGPDLRRILTSLGPTVEQVRDITAEIEGRRRDLRRLVHNVSTVTRAAASDGRLGDVVATGNQTLAALARQDRPLRETLDELPPAMEATSGALSTVRELADELGPTMSALTPPVRDLPTTLAKLETFAGQFDETFRRDFRPLVKEAQPLAAALGPAVQRVTGLAPDLSRSMQVANYVVNELGYNPPGKDEGMLFWLAWFSHNWNSVAGQADAHGGTLRARVAVNCSTVSELVDIAPLIKLLTGANNLCPTD